MDIRYENGAALLQTECFEPRHIFENGQAFRFLACGENAYEGVAYGRFLRVEKIPEGARLFPCVQQDFENVWKRYFDLERNYASLFSGCRDRTLKQGIEYGCGLRVLNQEPFETLISFIISANNHVKRIRGIIERICARCGEPFVFENRTWYRFPRPEELARLSVEELAECGSGYRAPYIREAAQMAAQGFPLDSLRSLCYADAKKELMAIPGVGPKVADCILLFSLGFADAFPADVWIRRVLREHYGFTGNDRQIYGFAQKRFGKCAGIAQQYLFFWRRENNGETAAGS